MKKFVAFVLMALFLGACRESSCTCDMPGGAVLHTRIKSVSQNKISQFEEDCKFKGCVVN